MSLMCTTCVSIKFEELVKSVSQGSSSSGSTIPAEKVSKLDRFIKKLAFEAVTDGNKNEFIELLKDNDPKKLSQFISKYDSRFSQKLNHFLCTEMLD